MEIRSNGGVDFAALGKRFRAAGANGAVIRKALTKAIQAELKKIIAEQQRRARAMRVKGVKGRGSNRRESFTAVRRKRAQRGGYGLRETTARSIKSRVSYSGRKVGARIYVDSSVFPQSQRRLPRSLNSPRGWRHPVWGHRDRWVAQKGEEYFDDPIRDHRGAVRKAVYMAVDDTMRKLR